MTTKYQKSLFIFRRDLRVDDNQGLLAALQLSQQVLPCFIADPRQIEKHPYQSKPALAFMLGCIADLQQQLRSLQGELAIFYGDPVTIAHDLQRQHQLEAIFINRDYTPFSRQRDAALAELCQSLGIDLHVIADTLLTEPEQVSTKQHTPYKVFTSFYNAARQLPVAVPQSISSAQFLTTVSTFDMATLRSEQTTAMLAAGGRKQALEIFNGLEQQQNYLQQRDFPALDSTSKLSAHLKFGSCSVREVFHSVRQMLGDEHPLLRQLYWRDFFTHIGYHFPQVFGQAFLPQFAALSWDNNLDFFAAWCAGKTGFPLVDAGMRELNATGFMHNRVRMVTASFLVKNLHINWRWGERYFAQHLVDYDPCVNNGNWQWAASTGCDAQPYFRIFNPWLQQQKYDPECRYIHRWLPELRPFPAKILHQWHSQQATKDYPAPIVDHASSSQNSKARYKQAALDYNDF